MYKFLIILLFSYGIAVTTEDIYDNSHALIIGINKYNNIPNLDYAVEDANSIASLLKDKFNFSSQNIKVLLNEEATLTNIKKSLADLSKSAEENDRVLIYFAGHGATDDLPDGGEMGYLLPIDGDADNLFTSSIPMDDIKRIASMSKSKHMLFLIDACYGGLAAIGARSISTSTPNYIDKITNDKSRQIITAGGKGEQVIEKSEWGHSAFTVNLLRALKNGKADLNEDGFITAEELGLFLKDKVTIDSDNEQTPQSRRFTSHEGEFIFINNVENLTIINKDTSVVDTTIQKNYEVLAKKIDELESKLNWHKVLSNQNTTRGQLSQPEQLKKPEVKFIPYDKPPKPIIYIRPIYPKKAQDKGLQGIVYIQFFINEEGNVTEALVKKGIPNTGLNDAALEAVKKSRWEPAQQNNKKVGVWQTVPVKFELSSH